MKPLHLASALLLLALIAYACRTAGDEFWTPNYNLPPTAYRYSPTDSLALHLHVYQPARGKGPFPAVVFFHGGGWADGSPEEFRPQARYFAARGAVTVLAEFRQTETTPGATPLTALRDVKSALRYVKANATELRIDPTRIVAVGGGTGGQLAAAAAAISYYNNAYDDKRHSPRPTVLVLLAPLIDNSPEGYGQELVGDAWRTFSPLHNVPAGFPPTLLLVGSDDPHLPLTTVRDFRDSIRTRGGEAEVLRYEGGHDFYSAASPAAKTALEAMDHWLIEQGLLGGKPRVSTGGPAYRRR